MDKIKQYKNLSMTAELDNDLAKETELLKQRYQKFIKATDQSHINALETLGVQKDTFGGLLSTKLMKLLPAELQKEWSSSDANDITGITALLNFIRDQVDAAERRRSCQIPVDHGAKNAKFTSSGKQVETSPIWAQLQPIFAASYPKQAPRRHGINLLHHTPTTLLLKIIYQKLWEAEIDWDVEAPPEIRKKWIAAMTGLNEFANLKIPRWIGYSKRVIQNAKIHVFGDASEAAYGAVAYKKVTLPRLELLSLLLAARLGEKLKNFLHIESWRTIFWADSLVALGWIQGDTNRWKPFVRNQVEAIKKFSGPNWWQHCPGAQNPVDLASRGAPAVTLVHSELWWNGPSWLKEDETKWPDSTPEVEEPSVHERIEAEAKSKTVTMSVAFVEPATSVEWHLDRIPSWNRLLRRTAWILRFASKNRPTNATQMKTPIKTGGGKQIMVEHQKVEELTKVELLIYWQLQKEAFPKTFQDLKEGRQPHHKEKIAALRPVWDARQKLIRITGRAELALRDREIEPAILLPTQHPVVKLIIHDRHVLLKHAGVKTTLSDLRERPLYYKHPTLRKKRKQTDPTSTTDPSSTDGFALEPTVKPPVMEPIEEPPTTEPTEENKENLQLDESLAKKKGTIKRPKSYACLFTCAVTRAVHLELTKTMSARDFLLAFRRFSARRGSVSIMYSDNAQTFRCVSKHLKVLRSDPAIHDLLAMRKTVWIFSTSLAPWWGGFWERMVRTMKDLLRRSNGRACLEYDEQEVSLIETESVVNARPLTYVAEGSDEPLPITPNQFLNNRRSNCTPPEPAENLVAPDATNLKLLEMDHQRREYVSDICERFVTDYFLQIDKFHCKGGPGRKIRVGEVVIIHDDNTKRLMWTIGVVKELITSRDGLIRSVTVKTPNGTLSTAPFNRYTP
ncbi:uncharacterized protein LOC123470673 [Daphnia magna]|uniref:uncharacterized protein LOC123470673 n=1 Tax=Daphnia magna TaxID=35525 RepID=UPI001E1BBA50|nr:uncharacterized protein LOC123470673 [Daphnia magna]